MGGSRFDSTDYADYSRSVEKKSRREVFKSYKVPEHLHPRLIQFRESRDSEVNPESTPIIVAFDVSGSMGKYAHYIATKQLGKLFDSILQRRPVPDPHIMFMGVDDAVVGDEGALQCTQFEGGNEIIEQLTDIWLEGGGGNNSFESYDLPWIFAAYKTQTDAWDKRKKKGYIFTIGDEEFPQRTALDYVRRNITEDIGQLTEPEEFLKLAQERYHIFHIQINEGGYARFRVENCLASWTEHLGHRALGLDDYTCLVELIVSAISISEGMTPEDAVEHWGCDYTEEVLRKSLKIEKVES
jgi:hypothetical protein